MKLRTTYIRIVGMLMSGTVIVMLLMGAAYWKLQHDMDRLGYATLDSESEEVQNLVVQWFSHRGSMSPMELLDDDGQHIYFAVYHQGRLILQSSQHPLPPQILSELGPASRHEVIYQRLPYRMLVESWEHNGQKYDIEIYQLIAQERHMLVHIRDLMLAAGVLGTVFATAINLLLGYKALEPVRKSWQLQRQWLLQLSHELQTPLAIVRAVLSSKFLDPLGREAALQAVDEASALIRDIVYLAKLRSLPEESFVMPVAASDLTREVSERLATIADARNIRLRGQADEGLFVNTTPDRWTRLVSTIFKNAIDHAPPGTDAHWSLQRSGQEGVLVCRNTRVLTHSMQDSGSTIKYGVGLMIAEQLVQEMRGQMHIKHRGGLFEVEIRIPLAVMRQHSNRLLRGRGRDQV